MIATIIVLIEVTDPKVYYYFIIFVFMMYVYTHVSMHVLVCTVYCLKSILYLICDALYIWGQIKFLLLIMT